ncbi:MAG: hypothetical protein JWM27_3187, partial [Gemmatimonadetes bacterium]|nr:hypothetical protein [Gemmatimonadota bacterium]
MHPPDADLWALLDGSLPPGQAAGLRGHASACRECAARLDAAAAESAELVAALALLDHAPPALTAVSVFRRAVRPRPAVRPAAIAAGIALVLAAAGGLAAHPALVRALFAPSSAVVPPKVPAPRPAAHVAAP